jgi:hypothetical protein
MAMPRFVPALRVAIAVQAATILIQAITAGLLLSTPDGRALHGLSAIGVLLAGVLHLVVAIMVWRPGGGSARVIAPAAGLLVATFVQMALGMAHVKMLHVPLGVLMFGAAVFQLERIRSSLRADAATA